ncbi:FecR family protein [Bacteroides sp.]
MNAIEKQKFPDDLIVAYLNGELNEGARTELEQWIGEDKSHKQHFYEMTEVWLAATAATENRELGKLAYERFKRRIEPSKAIKKISYRFRKIAAAAMLGGLILGVGYYLGSYTNKDSLNAIYTVEAPIGSQSRIALPDGTTVWLNVGSKLSYTSGYARNERHVKLEGEGYFEVAHNEKLPFIVNADEIEVKVLGTKFSVKAYEDDNDIEVILAEGSVRLIDKKDLQDSFLLKPEQQAIYSKVDGKVAIRKVMASQANNWTKGIHFFDDLTLEQIARQLEKSFNVPFVFKDNSKKKLTFYGDFRKEDSLDDILMIMSSSGKFHYRKTHSVIEIY